MTLDISNVQYATTHDTFKNYDTVEGSISVPSQSYTAGQFRSFTTSIPLERADATIQVLQNFSTDSAKFYIGSFVQVNPDANFIAQTRMTLNGDSLTAVCYVSNAVGTTESVTPFTVTILVKRYVTPFD